MSFVACAWFDSSFSSTNSKDIGWQTSLCIGHMEGFLTSSTRKSLTQNLCIIPPWMLHNSGEEMCLTRYNSFINSGIFQKKTYQTSLQAADVGFKKAGGWLPWLEFISSFWTSPIFKLDPSRSTPTCGAFFWGRPVMQPCMVSLRRSQRTCQCDDFTCWHCGFGWHFEVLVETEN